jgi:hypothetical protein
MNFIQRLQTRIAGIAIGPSSFRNPGTAGVVKVGREFCSKLCLKTLAERLNNQTYLSFLDEQTEKLENIIIEHFTLTKPDLENKSAWGLARKGLNIFIRDAFDNRYIADHYKLNEHHKWQLEIPLDKHTATMITNEVEEKMHKDGKKLPSWPGVKNLTRNESLLYQESAKELAKVYNLTSVDLDIIYWRHEDIIG